METIIQQILSELLEKIMKAVNDGKLTKLDALAEELSGDCSEAVRKILKVVIEETNLKIREHKADRKKEGLVLKEKNRPRRLLTTLGTISYERDYYYNKKRSCYETPLDTMLGVRDYERIGDAVCADLLDKATEVSYAKSAAYATGGEVSRQTVHNIIKKAPELEQEPHFESRNVEALHIYADEDHVHMQKPHKAKGKANQILPLAVVTEGIAPESGRRNKTVNPMYFTDKSFDKGDVWESIYGYLLKAYDMSAEPRVYIYGDGGDWIKKGVEEIPNAKYVMDGYHFEKALHSATGCFPNVNYAWRIHQAIERGDKKAAAAVAKEMEQRSEDEKTYKATSTFRKYMLNHWEGIVNRTLPDVTGSCTEAQVSHVFSERFSRNPMGWSKACLGELARCKTYKLNKGKITGALWEKKDTRQESYKEYAKKFINEYVCGKFDWSIFGGEAVNYRNGELGRFMNAVGGSGYTH